ncbi:MAG: TonB-dependent receptor, partial [Saprospiraceae bacterium]|nr:TonB-dependent receptor [Saprospiraceae bacterium]
TELTQGGNVSFLYGNDNYMKATASYSTGMMNDKFGVSVLLTHWQGDGWAEGAEGQGQNYFISAGLKANDQHSFNFLLTGAPQYHDQNFTKSISSHFNNPDDPDDFNIKYNGNWGTLDGEYLSLRRNYYHKPVANLNWDFSINEKSKLSTVLYASWGRGGGTGDRGDRDNRFFTDDGYYDWDMIQAANIADAGSEEYIIRASVNNHSWYGAVTNYETALTENINWSLGADLRTYRGSHFRQVVDLLGAPAFSQFPSARFPDGREVTATFEANPWKAVSNFADIDEQIHYSNDETISYGGVFSQLEYIDDKWSAFVQGAISNQSHIRYEIRNELEADEESEKVTNGGFNVKTGASYSPDENNTIFFNTGFYSRQPFHDNIYLNFSNFVNPVTENEDIFGLEAGYKYANQRFAGNINVYRSSWKNRTTTRTLDPGDVLPNGDTLATDGYRNTKQNQLHSGLELDFGYKINSKFKLKGYASFGNWTYEGTIDQDFFNEDRDLILSQSGDDVDGIEVGGAPQTSFGLGVDWKLVQGLSLDVDYNYYDRLYSNIGVSTESLELPSFGLLDLGLAYVINLDNGQLLTLRGNVYNLTGEEYISRAFTGIAPDANDNNNWNGVNRDNRVSFGKTTTWNVSARFSF